MNSSCRHSRPPPLSVLRPVATGTVYSSTKGRALTGFSPRWLKKGQLAQNRAALSWPFSLSFGRKGGGVAPPGAGASLSWSVGGPVGTAAGPDLPLLVPRPVPGGRVGYCVPLRVAGAFPVPRGAAPGGPPAGRGPLFLPRKWEKRAGPCPLDPLFRARSFPLARFGVVGRSGAVVGLFRSPSTCPDLERFFV